MPGTDGVTTPLDRLATDVNGDGLITLADVAAWPSAIFFLPGDGLLWALSRYAAPIARFLEIGPADYGGLLSAILSSCAWLASFIGFLILYQFIRDVDRRLTQATVSTYATVTLRARVARALWRQRWRAWLTPRAKASAVEVRTDLDLAPMQLRALELHSKLSAGYVLSVSDVAHALGARVRVAEDLLAELKRLGLLVRASCGADGESGYALSAGGRALLEFHERAAKSHASTAVRSRPSAASAPPARDGATGQSPRTPANRPLWRPR